MNGWNLRFRNTKGQVIGKRGLRSTCQENIRGGNYESRTHDYAKWKCFLNVNASKDGKFRDRMRWKMQQYNEDIKAETSEEKSEKEKWQQRS